jgi:hypothetical protein
MEMIRSNQAVLTRPEFDAKLKMAHAIADQLEKVIIGWGKAMEANKEAAALEA